MLPFEILTHHERFASGHDYHRQFLDMYLPEGVIGDIGCGYGRIAAFYEGPTRHFISIDNDAEVIAAVSKLLPNHDFRVGDAYKLPLPDNSLDAYIGLGIFELDGMRGRKAIKEASRVLRTNGIIYITVPYKNIFRQKGRKAMWRGMEIPSFSEDEMRQLLSDHGFDTILTRPSSIAHGLGPFRHLTSLFPATLNDEQGAGYRLIGHKLQPLANSLLAVGRKT